MPSMPSSVGADDRGRAGQEALGDEFAARARPRMILMPERLVQIRDLWAVSYS